MTYDLKPTSVVLSALTFLDVLCVSAFSQGGDHLLTTCFMLVSLKTLYGTANSLSDDTISQS